MWVKDSRQNYFLRIVLLRLFTECDYENCDNRPIDRFFN